MLLPMKQSSIEIDRASWWLFNNHDIFMENEAEVKVKFDDLRDPFLIIIFVISSL